MALEAHCVQVTHWRQELVILVVILETVKAESFSVLISALVMFFVIVESAIVGIECLIVVVASNV